MTEMSQVAVSQLLLWTRSNIYKRFCLRYGKIIAFDYMPFFRYTGIMDSAYFLEWGFQIWEFKMLCVVA